MVVTAFREIKRTRDIKRLKREREGWGVQLGLLISNCSSDSKEKEKKKERKKKKKSIERDKKKREREG